MEDEIRKIILEKNLKNKVEEEEEESSEITFLKEGIVVVTDEECDSIINGSMSEADKLEVFHNLISNLVLDDDDSKQKASDIFKYLLNREGGYDEAEIEFISYYIVYLNYYKTKYDKDGKVREGLENVTLPKVVITSKFLDGAAAVYDNNIVYVSEKACILPFKDGNKDVLFDYLQCLCHEMVHYKQDVESQNGLLSESSFAEILFASAKKQRANHVDNYRFRQIEVEAQIESMQYAIEIGSKFFPKYIDFQNQMQRLHERYLLDEALAMQRDDQSILATRDFYDIGILSVTVDHDFLAKYPQLKLFFDAKGEIVHIKSEEELLSGYQECKKNNDSVANIYEEFLIYIYHRDGVINNTNLSPELLAVKQVFISEQVKKELERIENIIKIINDKKHEIKLSNYTTMSRDDMIGIMRMRLQRLKSYYNFLSSGEMGKADDTLDELKAAIDNYDSIIIEMSIISSDVEIGKMLDQEINKDDAYIGNNTDKMKK